MENNTHDEATTAVDVDKLVQEPERGEERGEEGGGGAEEPPTPKRPKKQSKPRQPKKRADSTTSVASSLVEVPVVDSKFLASMLQTQRAMERQARNERISKLFLT